MGRQRENLVRSSSVKLQRVKENVREDATDNRNGESVN